MTSSPSSDLPHCNNDVLMEDLPNLETDLAQIQALIDKFEWEEALKECKKALERHANSEELLALQGSICLEMGLFEEAYEAFSAAHQVNPNSLTALLNLGQMSEGKMAVEWFEKAISVLTESIHLNKSKDAAVAADLSLQLSSVFCSIAELYMLPDLCDDSEAEEICENYLSNAHLTCPANLEIYPIFASFRLCQSNAAEAMENLKYFAKGLAEMAVKQKSFEESLKDESALLNFPSFECRLNAARLMIETGMLDEAVDILEGLENEDDEVVDIYYLSALVWSEFGDREAALAYLEDGEALLAKLKVEDEEMQSAMADLKQKVLQMSVAVVENKEIDEEDKGEESE